MSKKKEEGLQNIGILELTMYFVLAPLILCFGASTIPRWFKPSTRAFVDFQYLILGALLCKMIMLAIDVADVYKFTWSNYDIDYCYHAESVKIFCFDIAILFIAWYSFLFRKSLSSSAFSGLERVKYHFICVIISVATALSDALTGE